MPIKRILVPLSSQHRNGDAIRTALSLAQKFEAHLEALFVPTVYLPLRLAYEDTVAAREALEEAQSRSEHSADFVRNLFEGLLGERGIPFTDGPSLDGQVSASWRAVGGTEPDLITQLGSLFDIVVINRPNQPGEIGTDKLLEAALFGARRPVLVAPPDTTDETPTKELNIVIGWNRTAQSAIAVNNALPFLAQASAIEIFSVVTGAKQGPAPLEVARYLAAHGIDAEIKEMESNSSKVSEMLLAEAEEIRADLVVMGAYSHSRLREQILGGVTRDVLETAKLPVLMSH